MFYNGICISVLVIFGEFYLFCVGRFNGNYDMLQFFFIGFWLCKVYYSCKDGVIIVYVCLNGIVYDGKSGECKMGNYVFLVMCQFYCFFFEWSEGYDFSEGMKECEYF